MAAECPEAAEYFGHVKPPKEAKIPDWTERYWLAWMALRNDRHFGSMGGMSPIYYQALSRYARDHGYTGQTFAMFQRLVNAMDGEYLDHVARMMPKPTDNNGPPHE